MAQFLPENAVVWCEIPVSDMERSKAFYSAVLQNDLTDMEGPNPMARFAAKTDDSVAGHIYHGKSAPDGSGNTVHLAVPAPLEESLRRLEENGGKVVSSIITIPAGRFAYCLDPDGNSIGLFA